MDAEIVFRDLSSILGSQGLEFAVAGSYASGARGNPRQTNDIDILLALPADRIEPLFEALQPLFDVTLDDMQAAVRGADPYRTFQLFHMEQLFKVDVFLGIHPELVRSEFERADLVQVLPGVRAKCLTAEDVVIEKLLWYQMGNRVSDRQWNDIVGVIEVQGPLFDRAYVRDWAGKLGVLDLAEEAFAESKDY